MLTMGPAAMASDDSGGLAYWNVGRHELSRWLLNRTPLILPVLISRDVRISYMRGFMKKARSLTLSSCHCPYMVYCYNLEFDNNKGTKGKCLLGARRYGNERAGMSA
eukprot:scaffold398156_cov29-Prasinocladus_malaysianus.AAC.1